MSVEIEIRNLTEVIRKLSDFAGDDDRLISLQIFDDECDGSFIFLTSARDIKRACEGSGYGYVNGTILESSMSHVLGSISISVKSKCKLVEARISIEIH
jgi:hypothetical protein